MPNIALIQNLKIKHPDAEILYIGSSKGPEAKMIPEIGITFKGVMTGKFRRYFSFQNFIDILRIPIGTIQAFFSLRKFKPQVVFSKGGYVGIPVVYAAHFLKIPIILHESDVSPGLANKIAAKKASLICLSYLESKEYFYEEVKMVFTGNPVREFIYNGSAEKGYKSTGFSNAKPIILVMGGSQGAQHINETITECVEKLDAQIIHITGQGKQTDLINPKYKQFEYVNQELPDLYKISNVIVSRSGANSLAEISALGIPAVLIPIGQAASRGEQTLNAEAFKNAIPETVIIHDEDLNAASLLNALSQLINTKVKSLSRNNASNKIIEAIENMLVEADNR